MFKWPENIWFVHCNQLGQIARLNLIWINWTLLTPSSFLGGAVVKNLSVNARDTGDSGSILGSQRSFGRGHFLYSCLENYVDREAQWATVHEMAESDMTEWLSPQGHTRVCAHTHTHTHTSLSINLVISKAGLVRFENMQFLSYPLW